MEYRSIMDAMLWLALAVNLALAARSLFVLRCYQRRAIVQREIVNSAFAMRELFLAMCAQSWTLGEWPNIQMMALLHTWHTAAENAVRQIEAQDEPHG